ncbi:replication factor C small subunit [Candidatus Micrarchaeota archaeon]|nr:replication factor C small subunit [Candidatus Micrarchaeota archaeon]
MKIDVLPWTEKYRPKSLDDVVGQKEIIKVLKAFTKKRNMPNLLFTGPPGVGKTTSTLALARELYGEDYKEHILELNASDDRGIGIVRGKIKEFSRTVALHEVPFKIVFLDEADALTSDAQHALRRTMEMYADITRFILSCNYSSKIIEPLQSRTSVFRFKPVTGDEIKDMLKTVIEKENLEVDSEALDAIIYVSDGDMRRAINVLQGAAMQTDKITEKTIYAISSRARPTEVQDILKFAMGGEFNKARKNLDKLMVEYGMDGEDILLQMYYETINMDIGDKTKVKIVDKIGEYNFRMVEGANERIQLEALLAQLMNLE